MSQKHLTYFFMFYARVLSMHACRYCTECMHEPTIILVLLAQSAYKFRTKAALNLRARDKMATAEVRSYLERHRINKLFEVSPLHAAFRQRNYIIQTYDCGMSLSGRNVYAHCLKNCFNLHHRYRCLHSRARACIPSDVVVLTIP